MKATNIKEMLMRDKYEVISRCSVLLPAAAAYSIIYIYILNPFFKFILVQIAFLLFIYSRIKYASFEL